MNFLAHLLTGDRDEGMLVGSFAGDFCRGRLSGHPEPLQPGIRLHRAVDAFAEGHPAFSSVRASLRTDLGLYAAVGADMLIDHVLARDWSRWVDGEPLDRFANRCAVALTTRGELLPPDGRRVSRWMIDGRWLESYATLDGIRTALGRMTARARGVQLAAAAVRYEHDPQMDEDISRFLRDLLSDRKLLELGMRDDLH